MVWIECISVCGKMSDLLTAIVFILTAMIRQPVVGNTIMQIILNDGVLVKDSISVIEGSPLKLNCTSDVTGAQVTWVSETKVYIDFVRHDPVIEISSVRRHFAGVYTCNVTGDTATLSANVNVNVLYPPLLPVITGPQTTLYKDRLKLTCHSDANPAASYWWSGSKQPGGEVFAGGDVFEETVLVNDDYMLTFCWAENTMIPTVGPSMTSSAVQEYRTAVHRSVYIWELLREYTFSAGSTVDITCKMTGYPYPESWWEKVGSSFELSGDRLVVENVKANFSGYYTCNTENNVTLSNGTKRMTTDNRATRIIINDTNVPAECVKYLPTPPTPSSPTSPSPHRNNTGGCDTCTGNSSSSNGLIAAAVVGWFVAVTLAVVGTVWWIRLRNQSGQDTVVADQPETLSQINMMPDCGRKPTLPKRPATHHKKRQNTKSDHIYLELEAPYEQDDITEIPDDAANKKAFDHVTDEAPSTYDDSYLHMDESDETIKPLNKEVCEPTESLTDELGYKVPEGKPSDHKTHEKKTDNNVLMQTRPPTGSQTDELGYEVPEGTPADQKTHETKTDNQVLMQTRHPTESQTDDLGYEVPSETPVNHHTYENTAGNQPASQQSEFDA